ncbi:hypothetical protein GXP67_03745 [Rhodocytophaga rosea]|uniref:Uncharacterized protein n=1 Tax=Rhodocytophaga rosea TaxID=2704465 RepID=A0A6C0GDT5_9BACT|nr:hypothetical protein [Rhodocytophaga rosea]QHT65840.1 hypothetical protein GXP67_03745 [Rhodocytophaga rosea]
MKAVFTKIITYFLLGVVFLSSTGFGLIEHTCLIRNKKSASLFEKEGCCARKTTSATTEETTISSNTCCESETHVATFDIAPVVEKVAGFFSHIFFYVIDTLVSLFHAMVLSGQAVYQSADSSPPLTGRQLLIRYHSLQI